MNTRTWHNRLAEEHRVDAPRPVGAIRSRRPVAFRAMACVVTTLFLSSAQAQGACVQFDLNPMVGCRDVTPPEFNEITPDEKLVEARLQISSLVRYGSEDDLIEFLYRVESPERTLQVVEYSPKTTLASSVVGNVGIESKSEKTLSLGITASAHYDHLANLDATAANGSKKTSDVRYERLPSLDLLAASGTTARGTGVYFKLRASERTSLEGAKEFRLNLRVPRAWRGDYLRVICQARRHNRGVIRSRNGATICGTSSFVVAIYDAGDIAAKDAAAQLVRAEQKLREVAVQRREEIQRCRYKTVVHEIGAKMALVQPKTPATWLTQILWRPASAPTEDFDKHLPSEVRQATRQYRLAKGALHQLCGNRGAKGILANSL